MTFSEDQQTDLPEHAPYRCGLQPGQQVRLRKDLIIRDHKGRPTGRVHAKGEVWTVLPDSCSFRHDLWLQQPGGRPHTWDDDEESVSEWFEPINESLLETPTADR